MELYWNNEESQAIKDQELSASDVQTAFSHL